MGSNPVVTTRIVNTNEMNMRKNYVRPAINSMAFKERLMCSQSNTGLGATDIYSGWGDDYWDEHQGAKHYSVWDEQ